MSPDMRLHLRFPGDHVLHLVLHVHREHLEIRRVPLFSTREENSAKNAMFDSKISIGYQYINN